MLFLLALLSLVPAAQLCWELSKQLVGVALNPRFLQVDQEGISQKASQDVRIGRRGFLSRLQQELCRDSGVLFKSTFLMSSKSARTLAPVQTSSAMGIKSKRELHQWDTLAQPGARALRGLLVPLLELQEGVPSILQNKNTAENPDLLFSCERKPKKAPLTVECSTPSAEASPWCHSCALRAECRDVCAPIKSINLALMGTSDRSRTLE